MEALESRVLSEIELKMAVIADLVMQGLVDGDEDKIAEGIRLSYDMIDLLGKICQVKNIKEK